jgi:hypothetical protein
MRTLIAVLVPTLIAVPLILAAGVASAQPATVAPAPRPYINLERDRDARTVAQAESAKQHDSALRNDLSTMQASEQTRQVLADINAAGAHPAVPTVKFNPKAPPPVVDASQFAEIPNATLAASNARAVAASENRK